MTSLKWCLDCEKVFREDNCSSHLWLPLIQVLESKKESSCNVIKNLETKIQTLSSAAEEMGNIFENVFSIFKETLKEFEDIHENTETLKKLIIDLKQMYTNIKTPTDEASLMLHFNLCKDLSLIKIWYKFETYVFKKLDISCGSLGDSCSWLTDFTTNMEKKIVSNRLTWGQFDMLTEQQKFSVSCSSDDSSFEVILKKKAENSLLNNKRF
ncbi:hypothetical protein Avbf_08940 [Armadillidium vulgare]|nr:hypothetical protein Avbf_08940 [Armadillidium vulgare]